MSSHCDVAPALHPQLRVWCGLLFSQEPSGSFIELRAITPGRPPTQEFLGVDEVGQLGSAIRLHAKTRADVYIGVAPRTRQEGTRDAVRHSHALWADCDTPESLHALRCFTPEPSMIVASGRGHHGYWIVRPSVTPDQLERANRRLAYRLGADMQATDAARVLRPPGSINRKNRALVGLIDFTAEVFEVDFVVGDLPDPPVERPRRDPTPRTNGGDPLLSIPPADYVEALIGEAPGRDGKVHCPFHQDWNPSLHVYDSAERGWFCFQCRRGGSVIDLAAGLAGIPEPRGAQFIAITHYLREKFG